jgi:glycosyl hydrolase family 113
MSVTIRAGRSLLGLLVGLVLGAGITTGAAMATASSHVPTSIGITQVRSRTASRTQLGFNTYVQDLCQSKAVWASDARGQFAELKALGANSIALAFPLYMSSLNANVVFSERACGTALQTPSPARLRVAIKTAHSMHLRVLLRPMVDPFSLIGGWRGTIDPVSAASWFRSYFAALVPYLKLAQQQKVEEFAISTELDSMAKQPYWRSLIKEARHLYSGSLIFTIVWAQYNKGKVHWKGTSPGMDTYQAVHLPPTATVAQLLDAWNSALTSIDKVPFSLSSATIDEAAIPAQDGAYYEPWAWSLPSYDAFDQSVQANWYAMLCSFFKLHKMRGIYFWGIWFVDGADALPSTPSPGLAQEIQPASAQVIASCYAKG